MLYDAVAGRHCDAKEPGVPRGTYSCIFLPIVYDHAWWRRKLVSSRYIELSVCTLTSSMLLPRMVRKTTDAGINGTRKSVISNQSQFCILLSTV